MITEVASTFIIIAQMVLTSGEEVTAYGEQYSTLAMCQSEARKQTAEINIEIKKAIREQKLPMFKAVYLTCEDLSELEKSGIVDKGEFDNE